jgi:hypothetical protein
MEAIAESNLKIDTDNPDIDLLFDVWSGTDERYPDDDTELG